MATNLSIDEELLNEAVKVGNHRTKKSAVNEALKEYVMRKKRKDIVTLFGTINYDPDYDYKEHRKN